MSRKIVCVNCEDEDPIFRVEIVVNKYLEASNSMHFAQYPTNHFTCARCGDEAVEVTA